MALKNKIIYFILQVFWTSLNLYGQSDEMEFDHYTTNEGLSHGYIFCITQDKKDFIWIGTANGLNRFDGLTFKTYFTDARDTTTLPSNEIDDFIEDSTGNFWIMTSRMFCLYNRDKDIFSKKLLKVDNKIYDNLFLTSCFIDSKGYLWIGARSGIFRIKLYNNPNVYNKVIEAEKFLLEESDLDKNISHDWSTVFSFVEDENKKIWVVSFSDKLFCFDEKQNKFQPYRIGHPESKKFSDKPKKLIKDKDNDFIMSIENCGLLVWYRKKNEFRLFKPNGTNSGPNDDILSGLIQDKNEHIWVGSRSKGGINIFNKKTGKFSYYLADEANPNSLNSNAINCFYEDKTGSVWIGTGTSNGINKYTPIKRKFRGYYYLPKKKDKLNFNNVLCFAEGKSDKIWIGTDGGGLNELDRKTGKFLHYKNNPSNPNSLSSNAIISICEDHGGTLWMGTYNGGLARKKGNNFYAFCPDPGNPWSIGQRHVWYVFEDSKQNLWVSTLNKGLDLFNRKTNRFYHFITKEGDSTCICNNTTLQVFEDSKQNIYITSYTGVSVFNLNDYDFSKMPPKIKFHNLIHRDEIKNGLSSYGIYCVAEDKQRNIWFGTMTNGIDKLDPVTGKFINYSKKDGLPGNAVNSILVDELNNLWLATDKGLAKFNPKTKDIQVFDLHDGLQNINIHGWAMKTKDGEMFFGGTNGFNSFYPDRIKYNTHKPNVLITGLRLFNKLIKVNEKLNNRIILTKDISESQTLTLNYNENFFTLEFTALEFTVPEKNRYAYIMKGFDSDWVQCGTKREASYTNLNPGKYIFKVKACNNDGFWNEQGTSLTVIILPPWWRTWWFLSIVFLSITATTYFIYYLKISNYRKHQAMLAELVKKRTFELEHTNTLLIDRQTRIEAQAKELQAHTESLVQKNELLLQKQKLIQIQSDELKTTNKQLSVLNSTKDKFFSIIAHDLRNPFHAVIGFSELLLLDIEKYPPEKVRRFLNLIHSSSQKGNDLLENLLQWSRSETGKISYEPVNLNLYAIAENSINLLNAQAIRKNIQISQEIEPSITIYADENMLSTVIRNLISNAIKFTHENGKIAIKARVAGPMVEISVIDNGIGIPEENIRLLFHIESNISTKGTSYESGTGLGLILCKEFVEKHKGKIWVESEEGKGSEFKFTIPVA